MPYKRAHVLRDEPVRNTDGEIKMLQCPISGHMCCEINTEGEIKIEDYEFQCPIIGQLRCGGRSLSR